MIATLQRLEVVDPEQFADRFFAIWHIEHPSGSFVRFQHGARGSAGTLEEPHRLRDTASAKELVRAHAQERAARGYVPVLTNVAVDVPDEVTLEAPTPAVAAAFETASRKAWLGAWETRLAELRDPSAREPVGWLALLPNLVGQERTQPWGAPLGRALAGCPRMDGVLESDAAASLLLVGDSLASWLRHHYEFTCGSVAFPQMEVVPASSSDERVLLEATWSLWMPGATADSGNFGAFSSAVAAARLVLAPRPQR